MIDNSSCKRLFDSSNTAADNRGKSSLNVANDVDFSIMLPKGIV